MKRKRLIARGEMSIFSRYLHNRLTALHRHDSKVIESQLFLIAQRSRGGRASRAYKTNRQTLRSRKALFD